ncbi:pantoate-beta-alanine ligase [Savitreella phatthalungensis]
MGGGQGMSAAAPRIIRTFAEYRAWRASLPLITTSLSRGTQTTSHVAAAAPSGRPPTIGFVPTMGALHAGHLALARRARAETDLVVMSIFVNPAQFAPTEDLSRYPRTLEADLARIAETAETSGPTSPHPPRSAVDVLILPQAHELYPTGIVQEVSSQRGAFINVHGLSEQLEGSVRPHFFRGVATVVHKLLAGVRPDVLYLGQKDVQQSVVVKRMMTDLLWHLDTSLRIGETVRESDGLAMSSRNVYLSPEARKTAPILHQALATAKRAYTDSGERDAEQIRGIARAVLERANAPGATQVEIEYVNVNDNVDLADWQGPLPSPPPPARGDLKQQQQKIAILSAAIRLGNTRILDNVLLNGTVDDLSLERQT